MHRSSSSKVLHQHGFVDPYEVGVLSETLPFSRTPKRSYRKQRKSMSVLELQASTGGSLPSHGELKPCRSQSSRPSTAGALTGEPQFIRLQQLLELIPVSASTVWRWVRNGRIRAFKLGPRITVFSREEVMDVFFSEAAR